MSASQVPTAWEIAEIVHGPVTADQPGAFDQRQRVHEDGYRWWGRDELPAPREYPR